MKLFKKAAVVLAGILLLMNTSTAFAMDNRYVLGDPGSDMVADFVVRPVAIAAAGAGCVLFVATLPFTVWSKERINKAGRNLVVEPARYAFVRPLGDLKSK